MLKTDQPKTPEAKKTDQKEKVKASSPLAAPLPQDDEHVYLQVPKTLLDRPNIKKLLEDPSKTTENSEQIKSSQQHANGQEFATNNLNLSMTSQASASGSLVHVPDQAVFKNTPVVQPVMPHAVPADVCAP